VSYTCLSGARRVKKRDLNHVLDISLSRTRTERRALWSTYACFPNASPPILLSSLARTFFYCRYKSSVTKLITLQTPHYTELHVIFLTFH